MDVAGTDATLEFEEAGHSHAARRELELYLIGELLAPEPEAALPERAQDARLDGAGHGASERDELYTEPPASVAGRANSHRCVTGGPGCACVERAALGRDVDSGPSAFGCARGAPQGDERGRRLPRGHSACVHGERRWRAQGHPGAQAQRGCVGSLRSARRHALPYGAPR
jgi:hypothetical protein